MSDTGARRLKADEVRYWADLSSLQIKSSEELSPSPTTVGQPEALEALELGVTMRRSGYNVFLAGEIGTGRFASIRMMIERAAVECPLPPSYSYVHNFDDPDRPALIALPHGLGREFRRLLDRLRNNLGEEIPAILQSELVTKSSDRLLQEYQKKSQTLFQEFEVKVDAEGFRVVQGTDSGGSIQVTDIFPVVKGEPVPIDRLAPDPGEDAKAAADKERIRIRHAELKIELRKLMQEHRALRTSFQRRLTLQQQQHVRDSLVPLFDEVRVPFIEHDDNVARFLDTALDEILEHLAFFHEIGSEATPEQTQARLSGENLLSVLRSNLVTETPEDDGKATHCPVLEENYPSHRNLFGTIETGGDPGTTSFMDIKGGSILRANGGFLILSARDILAEPRVYDTLKRTLRKNELEITPRDEGTGGQLGLKPSPIPVDVKVILVGEPMTYEVLYASDPDFRKIFKIKVEFDNSMALDPETLQSFLSVLRRIQQADEMPPFDCSALEALVEEGVRMSGNRKRLTTSFSDLADVMREASHRAGRRQVKMVERADIERTITQRCLRHNLVERKLHEHIRTGKLLTEVDGSCVGQINGLAYYSLEHAEFGTPARISATTAIGRAGIVNIEREADLSGSIHDKGVLLLSGFLAELFAQDKPLCLHANIAFEQSYATIDGDSASCAELIAVLSSLSGHGLRQDIAVTGSLNQRGMIQPVGGVTEKIEGFYRACKIKGLTNDQGVVIPKQNVDDVHLSAELTERVREGRFSVYVVSEYGQVLELLTGRPVQETLDAADQKLGTYANLVRAYGGPAEYET